MASVFFCCSRSARTEPGVIDIFYDASQVRVTTGRPGPVYRINNEEGRRAPMFTNLDSHGITYTRKSGVADDQLKLVADCLESLRGSAGLRSGISEETRGELEQYLALAEAALRRAHAESRYK